MAKEGHLEREITAIDKINKNHDSELQTLTTDNQDRITAISALKKQTGETEVANEKISAAHEKQIETLNSEHT